MNSKVLISFCLLTILTLFFFISFYYRVEDIETIESLNFSYSDDYRNNSNVSYVLKYDDLINKYVATIKPAYASDSEVEFAYLDKSDLNKLINNLNKYRVQRWEKFSNNYSYKYYGKNSFIFSIKYNNDKEVFASGKDRFPTNYYNVKDLLNDFFLELY